MRATRLPRVANLAVNLRLAERLESRDVTLALVEDGDHRLSREADLARLERTLHALL